MKTLAQLAIEIVDASSHAGQRDVVAKAMDRTVAARIGRGWSLFAPIPDVNRDAHKKALVEEARAYAHSLPVKDAIALKAREAFFDSQLLA